MARLKMVSAQLDHETGRLLKIISAETATPIRSLMAEALHDLFLKRGKAPPAELVKIARQAA